MGNNGAAPTTPTMWPPLLWGKQLLSKSSAISLLLVMLLFPWQSYKPPGTPPPPLLHMRRHLLECKDVIFQKISKHGFGRSKFSFNHFSGSSSSYACYFHQSLHMYKIQLCS